MLAQSRRSPKRAFRLLMPDDPHPDGPAGPDGRVYQGWPAPVPADGAPPVLDLGFDSGTLHTVRAQTRACVSNAGFREGQAEEVVLAVHELAANAVSHGGGAGWLRVWNRAGALYCQVDDGDVPTFSSQGADPDGIAVIKPNGSSDRASVNSLPCEHGHGLWVVQQVADQMQSLSGPGGTSVLIRFDRGAMRHFA
jgi:anti-sigma regulatory factor (Ser/Thr protein kinase)